MTNLLEYSGMLDIESLLVVAAVRGIAGAYITILFNCKFSINFSEINIFWKCDVLCQNTIFMFTTMKNTKVLGC